MQHFERVIGIFPRSALDKLQRYRDSIPSEVICEAFDEAAESGHRSWKYANGILKSWQADGVRTLGDVEARREARKKPEQQPERKLEVQTLIHRKSYWALCSSSLSLPPILCQSWKSNISRLTFNQCSPPCLAFGMRPGSWTLWRLAPDIQSRAQPLWNAHRRVKQNASASPVEL